MGGGGLDDTVSPEFGASPSFTLVDVEDQETLAVEIVVNPKNCVPGTTSRPARDLVDRGVDAVIAGAFGPEAILVFSSAVIRWGSPFLRVRVLSALSLSAPQGCRS
ncbi:NifB/NifX family molybdenum-iron cluster-binding protein [Methanoculleus sp.]|uniref:NifB/NifX family molybdenum-iron cluster-binding protein n=1 Tax=Methanoculleus sp. TaxID=90427 RepID=UPI00344D5213